jgi:hypothetical protein
MARKQHVRKRAPAITARSIKHSPSCYKTESMKKDFSPSGYVHYWNRFTDVAVADIVFHYNAVFDRNVGIDNFNRSLDALKVFLNGETHNIPTQWMAFYAWYHSTRSECVNFVPVDTVTGAFGCSRVSSLPSYHVLKAFLFDRSGSCPAGDRATSLYRKHLRGIGLESDRALWNLPTRFTLRGGTNAAPATSTAAAMLYIALVLHRKLQDSPPQIRLLYKTIGKGSFYRCSTTREISRLSEQIGLKSRFVCKNKV